MANKKSESKKSESSSNKRSSSVWSLNKISFWLIVVTAALYLTAALLAALSSVIEPKISLAITHAAMAVAEALTICVVGILGWRYVRNKGTAWIILYIIVLVVIAVGIVLPRILL